MDVLHASISGESDAYKQGNSRRISEPVKYSPLIRKPPLSDSFDLTTRVWSGQRHDSERIFLSGTLTRWASPFPTLCANIPCTQVLITDFFGSVRNIQLSSEAPVNVSAKTNARPNDNADSPLSDLEWTLSESLDNTFATDEKRQNWTTPPLIPFLASCVIVLLTFLFSNR